MSSARYDDFSINTIIGPNTSLKGNIETGGFTRIDGSIIGNVNAKGKVVIGERARMKGNVSGTAITVGGVVHGHIIASESLVILSSALVLGDIITRRIQVDDGCLIHGKVLVCADKESWANAVNEYKDNEGIKFALPVFAKKTPTYKELLEKTTMAYRDTPQKTALGIIPQEELMAPSGPPPTPRSPLRETMLASLRDPPKSGS